MESVESGARVEVYVLERFNFDKREKSFFVQKNSLQFKIECLSYCHACEEKNFPSLLYV